MSNSVEGRVRIVAIRNAVDFLAILSPSTGAFVDGQYFRGHGDADWKLLPSAFRLVTEGRVRGLHPESNYKQIVDWEARRLANFVHTLDQQGYDTPGGQDDTQFEASAILFADSTKKPYDRWPDQPVLRTLALAQHYGVPTRLLDWTWRPEVAAYFAARDCLTCHEPPSFLAVWVANKGATDLANPNRSLNFSQLPSFENPNLRAQGGTMMVFRQFRDFHDPWSILSFDQELRFASGDGQTIHGPAYVKLTLPSSEAATLLRLLYGLGIHGGSMFPGYRGAARLTAENELWAWEKDESWIAALSQNATIREALLTRLKLDDLAATSCKSFET